MDLGSDAFTRISLSMTSRQSDKISKIDGIAFLNDGLLAPITSVEAGDYFYVFDKYTRSVACNYTVSIQIIGGPDVAYQTQLLKFNSSWNPAGQLIVNERLELPIGLTPGPYRLIKKVVDHCDADTYYSTIFDLPILVTTPSPS